MTISGCDKSKSTTWECPLNELVIRGVHCIIVENDNNNTVIINKQCNILRNPLLFNIASPTLIKQCPPWCIYLCLRHSINAPVFLLIGQYLPHVDHTLCIRQSETEQVQRSSQGMHRVWFFSAVGPRATRVQTLRLMNRERTGYS